MIWAEKASPLGTFTPKVVIQRHRGGLEIICGSKESSNSGVHRSTGGMARRSILITESLVPACLLNLSPASLCSLPKLGKISVANQLSRTKKYKYRSFLPRLSPGLSRPLSVAPLFQHGFYSAAAEKECENLHLLLQALAQRHTWQALALMTISQNHSYDPTCLQGVRKCLLPVCLGGRGG